jgi:hypothetical protein
MPKNVAEKLVIKICESRQLKQLVNILFFCAFVACWANDLPKDYQYLLSGLVVVFWALHNNANSSSPYFLRYTANLGWGLSLDDTDYREILILDGTVITYFAILLFCKTKAQTTRSILIARDSMSANDYRSLIGRLKLSRQVEPNE